MNKVHLNGKIIDIKTLDKVIYITLLCRNGRRESEFIPVTIFNTEFFNRYFYKDKWISIIGYLHMNPHGEGYKKMEVIAEEILFSGDAREVDLFINEQLARKE